MLASSADISFAKRAAPEGVTPITVHGITYSAPPEAMGFVVASNNSSGKELWRKRIYTVHIDPALERDVQEVFITSLTARGDTLLVTNERGERFSLDLHTRTVTRKTDRNT